MTCEIIDPQSALQKLYSGVKLLDVRAPVEFAQGSIFHSENIPILNNMEREEIGKKYKILGQEEAIRLGNQLVSGENKLDKILAWKNFFEKNPDGFLTCFRGGLRSKTAQQWLADIGINIPRVADGYKELRRIFTETLEKVPHEFQFVVLSGNTGSGKTKLLRSLDRVKYLDLEQYAEHRGSAFGAMISPQPSQANFENRLAFELLKFKNSGNRQLIVEDESAGIGSCYQPRIFFDHLRASSTVLIAENFESRVELIFEEYISNTAIGYMQMANGLELFDNYDSSLKRISKKLGGARFSEIDIFLQQSRCAFENHQDLEINKEWIKRLLLWYYDPLYERSWEKRKPKVLFQGTRQEVREYLTGR